MMIILYILLIFNNGCYTEGLIFEKKTVSVGDNVNLTCIREATGSLFWIKLESGEFPAVLGISSNLEKTYPHITLTKKNSLYELYITKAKKNDSGVYYCFKLHVTSPKITYLAGINLTVADLTAVPTPAPVHPENSSVTPQGPLSSESEEKTCPEERTVSCSASGSHQSESGFIHGKGACFDECEKTSEGHRTRRCICSFSMNITSSDIGTYRCSVGLCEENLCVNGSSPDSKAIDSHQDKTLIILMSAVFILILIVIAVLIYSTNKQRKISDFSDDADAAALQSNPASDSEEQQHLQTAEYSVVYAATTFTKKKTVKRELKKTESGEEESIYSEVKTLGVN